MINLGKIKLDSIAPEEQIIKLLHRSWFNIASQYVAIFMVVGVLFATLMSLPAVFPEMDNEGFMAFYFFLITLSVLAVWIYCFLIWIDYYFDIWIITSDKIINVEQKSVFVRRISEVKYEKIQDVTVETTGILQTVINYGDVFVQTAGDNDNINFRKISKPQEIKNLIVRMQKEKELKRSHDFGEAIKDGLSLN